MHSHGDTHSPPAIRDPRTAAGGPAALSTPPGKGAHHARDHGQVLARRAQHARHAAVANLGGAVPAQQDVGCERGGARAWVVWGVGMGWNHGPGVEEDLSEPLQPHATGNNAGPAPAPAPTTACPPHTPTHPPTHRSSGPGAPPAGGAGSRARGRRRTARADPCSARPPSTGAGGQGGRATGQRQGRAVDTPVGEGCWATRLGSSSSDSRKAKPAAASLCAPPPPTHTHRHTPHTPRSAHGTALHRTAHLLSQAKMRCPAALVSGSARQRSPNSQNSVTSMGVGPPRAAPMNVTTLRCAKPLSSSTSRSRWSGEGAPRGGCRRSSTR